MYDKPQSKREKKMNVQIKKLSRAREYVVKVPVSALSLYHQVIPPLSKDITCFPICIQCPSWFGIMSTNIYAHTCASLSPFQYIYHLEYLCIYNPP